MKVWRSLDDQVRLLRDRGLVIDDPAECRRFLMRVGYYHLSGYARFFQVDPAYGDNRFKAGVRFSDIAELQILDTRLRNLSLSALADVELALRTGFAYRFAELHRTPGALWDPASFAPPARSSSPVHEKVLEDLDKAKQPFISRHRVAWGQYLDLPPWIAVEALQFGILSKAVEQCANPDIRKALADDFGVAHQGFSSQIRAFVTLRNACAHSNRLWNDVARIQASVPNNILQRAKRRVGSFHPQSNYQVLVALEQFLPQTAAESSFMAQVDELLATSEPFASGLRNPCPY